MPKKGVNAHEIIARRMQQARLSVPDGMSQRGLGIKMGIPEELASPRINRYEHAVHAPDAQTLLEMAKVLGVPPGFLITADDRMAELILGFARLSTKAQQELLAHLRQVLGDDETEKVKAVMAATAPKKKRAKKSP